MSSIDYNINANSEISDIMEIKIKLKEVQRDRINLNKETQFLKNRINLYKAEEENTWKKIEITRNNTQRKINQINHHYHKSESQKQLKTKNEIDLSQKYIKAELIKRKRNEAIANWRSSIINRPASQSSKRDITIKVKEDKYNDYLIKRERFKQIKQMENDYHEKIKEAEIDRKIRVQKKLNNKIEKMEEDYIKTQDKLNEYEYEEMEILKRMQKSTKMLQSMSQYLSNLSQYKSKNQFAQNPYKSLLDSNSSVLVRKNTIGNNKKEFNKKKSLNFNKHNLKLL